MASAMMGVVLRRSAPMKRTPMKRGDSQLRRTEMKRGSSEMARTPVKARSAKRSQVMRDDRVPMIKALVEAGVGCLIGPVLAEEGIHPGCTGEITGMHERRKRSSAGSLVNPENLIPACSICNSWVEDEAGLARELFGTALVVREGDEQWVRLSKRNDR